MNKTLTLGGRTTPLRSNISTPKGEKMSNLYNSSVCKTEGNSDVRTTPGDKT